MTGFGEATAEGPQLSFSVSARSVNHRYLDIVVRLPEALRRHEQLLTDLVRSALVRGRVELRVDCSPIGNHQGKAIVRRDLLASYLQAISEAREEGLVSGELSLSEVLRLPEVVAIETVGPSPDDDDLVALTEATQTCLEDLITVRAAEGERLRGAMAGILSDLGREVTELGALRADLQASLRSRLEARISDLLGDTQLDPERIATEVAILSEKSDIQEELDRLQAHVDSFEEHLNGEAPAGKKLDFLCQEILRELNTISSKCRDTAAVERVLEGKVACEKLREQVQNIQ